jgi:hypothetical protein
MKFHRLWLLRVLLGLGFLYNTYVWAVALWGITPGWVNEYTGWQNPDNMFWYAVAGLAYYLIVAAITFFVCIAFPSRSAKERKQFAYHRIARTTAAFAFGYLALLLLSVGYAYTSDYKGTLIRPETFVLLNNSVASIAAMNINMAFFANWIVILLFAFIMTTVLNIAIVYILFFGVYTGFAAIPKIAKGIGAKKV